MKSKLKQLREQSIKDGMDLLTADEINIKLAERNAGLPIISRDDIFIIMERLNRLEQRISQLEINQCRTYPKNCPHCGAQLIEGESHICYTCLV